MAFDGLLTNRALVAAKVEVTEGTEIALADADANLLVYDASFNDDVELVERNPILPHLSRLKRVVGKQFASMTFSVEVRGSGVLATAPSWGRLFRASKCAESEVKTIAIGAITGVFRPGEKLTAPSGFEGRAVRRQSGSPGTYRYVQVNATPPANPEVITGAASGATVTTAGAPVANQGYEYRPISTGDPSLSIALYLDGKKHSMYGARGTVTAEGRNGAIPMFRFEFKGVYGSSVDTALLAPTFETTVPSAFVGVGLYLDTIQPLFASFDLNLGGTLTYRETATAAKGALSVKSTERAPVLTIDPEDSLVADYDYLGKVHTQAEVFLYCEVGSGTANVVSFGCARATLNAPRFGERTGIATLALEVVPFVNVNDPGDNEFQVAMTS